MESFITNSRSGSSELEPNRVWKTISVIVGIAAVCLSLAIFALHRDRLGEELLVLALLTFCIGALLHARFLGLARKQYRHTSVALQARELEFQSIFENALDAIFVLDDQAFCRDANPSALHLLGVGRAQLIGQSIGQFYESECKFETSWQELLRDKCDRGQLELVRGDGSAISVEFTATTSFLPSRHMMILRDITPRRLAQAEMSKNLALAKRAWQEADAQRQATLALTQDLRMNHVLDTLLRTLSQLVPYDAAQVLLVETDSRLFLAREVISARESGRLVCPQTLDAAEYSVLRKALASSDGILISNTLEHSEWRSMNEEDVIRSWLGVPLRSSNQVLGLLSLVHTNPAVFSEEHLRIAGSLSISAAVAIQNARLYERAEIYGAELELRIADLHRTEVALEQSEEGRKASHERFQKLFRATPIAFSVTTLAEGVFVDVNEDFERRYGYSRAELIGRNAEDLRFWEYPEERIALVARLSSGTGIHGAVTRFRHKSGDLKYSLYSAESIHLDGHVCLLVVSDDVPSENPQRPN